MFTLIYIYKLILYTTRPIRGYDGSQFAPEIPHLPQFVPAHVGILDHLRQHLHAGGLHRPADETNQVFIISLLLINYYYYLFL